MRRLWIAAAILLVMLVSTLGNSFYLNQLMDGYKQHLTSAHQSAVQGSWDNAAQLTEQVEEDWQEHDFYLHVMLPHKDIDAIHLTFREVREYLELEETDQYTAANARLIAQLGLLGEMEQLNVKNIL